MKRKLKVNIRRNRYALIIAASVLTLSGFVLVNQEMKLQELKYEAHQLQLIKDEKAEVVNQLNLEVESLDTDEAKEALARQKLNMIKKDEILYIVEPAEGGN